MKHFRINYIDGHDLRYKSFETTAKDKNEALSNLWATYKDGDFDHRIVEIIVLKEPADEGMRIEGNLLSPIPFARQKSEYYHNNLQ